MHGDLCLTHTRLTVSILAKNSARRLERLLAEVALFADQIVVGVDVDSTDGSLETASRFADVVFRFRHDGQISAARMMIFDYATGDWILVIDDDERLEDGLAALLPELMADPAATHFWFARKWVVDEQEAAFLFVPPWYPDWQLRLFRNDRSLVWKPNRPHSGYHVMGPGLYEQRAALLHYEPVWCSPEERQAKMERYRASHPRGAWESHYVIPEGLPTRVFPAPAEPPAPVEKPGDPAERVVPEVLEAVAAKPGWGVEVLEVDMVAATHRRHAVVATVRVRNTGTLAWWPAWGIRSASIYLTYHLRDPQGKLLAWEQERALTLAVTSPGAEATFVHVFTAPEMPGDYLLEWDMVSEGEVWFAESQPRPPVYSPLHVV